MNLKYIKKEIDKHDIISFDIFDTLLVRMTRNPRDIFYIVEQEYNKNFKKNGEFYYTRINSEKKARFNSDREEISIEEIYENMDNFNEEEKKWLIDKELEIESNLLILNPKIIPIYKYCVEKNKKIIIESDMYLSKERIVSILEKYKINYYRIFLSSEIYKTKRSGSMFEYMLEELNANSKDILHIGDSIKSDFISPLKKNIKSILIGKNYKKTTKKITFKEFDKLINLKYAKKSDFFWNIGFDILGPFYLSYSLWLQRNFREKEIQKVFFLSRDGYIMKRCFDLLKDEKISSNYLYVSRNSLIIPALYYTNSLEEVIEITNIDVLECIDIKLFIKKIGLKIEDCLKELSILNIDINEVVKGSELNKNYKIKKLYELLKMKISSNSKKELDELLEYLKMNNFDGKLAIVDIGWQGTMQKALNIILKRNNINIDIYGYYVGVKKNALSYNRENMYGFCFSPMNPFLENYLFSFGGLFEYFYSNEDGSVINYRKNKPVLALNEYKDSDFLKIMTQIQNGGLEYLKFSLKFFKYYDFKEYELYSIKKLIKFGINPNNKITKKFRNLYYSNIDNFYLLPQHNLFYYLLNIKKLKKDLNQSFWKVGFLKQLFKIPFPYFKLYEILKGR